MEQKYAYQGDPVGYNEGTSTRTGSIVKLTFIETAPFMNVRESLFENDENFRQFQNALMDNPRKGDSIPGTGGIRKVRWADAHRGKGKRGGIRVIYLFVEQKSRIYFLSAYNKNIADLTPAEKKEATQIARRLGSEQ